MEPINSNTQAGNSGRPAYPNGRKSRYLAGFLAPSRWLWHVPSRGCVGGLCPHCERSRHSEKRRLESKRLFFGFIFVFGAVLCYLAGVPKVFGERQVGSVQALNTAAKVDAKFAAVAVDTKDPNTFLDSPTANQQFYLSSVINMRGSATDNVAVSAVKVAIKDRGSQKWQQVDGVSWGDTIKWFTSTLSAPNMPQTSWQFNWTPRAAGSYAATMQAFDSSGNKDLDKPVQNFSVIADTTAPTAPTGLTAIPRDGPARISLSWAPTTDNVSVVGYELQRNSVTIASTTGLSYTDSAIHYDTAYTYRVRALDAANNHSDWSAAVTTFVKAPDVTPPNVSVASPTASQSFELPSQLTAKGSASDDTSVDQVQVSLTRLDNGQWLQANGTWASQQAWLSTQMSAGVSDTLWSYTWGPAVPPVSPGGYSWQVRATDPTGNARMISVDFAVTGDVSAPSVPSGLSAANAQNQSPQVQLNWQASSDNVAVALYEITRNTVKIGEAAQGTSFTDSSVSYNTTYSYQVRAKDQAGNVSQYSTAATVTVPPPPPPDYTFGASGLDGAGFQNVIAVAPDNSGTVLSGADVSGVHKSTNGGDQFIASNTGFWTSGQLKIASLAYSRKTPRTVYAASGSKGSGGGLFVSTDSGDSWRRLSAVPQFSGGNNFNEPVPAPHPRSTGDLIALDETNGVIYVGTYNQGVMRSTDGGNSWSTLGMAGKYIRGLIIDPAHPDVVYAATYGDKIWKTTSARGAGSFTQLANSPATSEEPAIIGGALYSASGSLGVHKSLDGGQSWQQLGVGSIKTDGPAWTSIDGYVTGGTSTIFVGADKPDKGANNMFESVMRSGDGGVTWQPITVDPAKISYQVAGTGDVWWLSQDQPGLMLGRGTYTSAQIKIDPVNRQNIYVAGRSGVWRSTDGGSNWSPTVRGMGVTINRKVMADPNVPGRLYTATIDWVFTYSNDGGAHFRQNKPSANAAYGLALDTSRTPSVAYVGVGDRDENIMGEIYSNVDAGGAGSWVSEDLAVVAGGKRPLAVSVNRVGGQPVILAAVEGSGLWRKANGAWSRVSATAMSGVQNAKAASFAWLPGSTNVFLYDLASGVWRSGDSGQSWIKIWSRPSAAWHTGYLALDPTERSTLYVSNKDGLYRLPNSLSGSVDTGTLTPATLSVTDPGPLTFDDAGALYATSLVSSLDRGRLWRSDDRGATWRDLSDPYYRSGAGLPFALDVGPDGRIYVALDGNGLYIGKPAGCYSFGNGIFCP